MDGRTDRQIYTYIHRQKDNQIFYYQRPVILVGYIKEKEKTQKNILP